MTDNDIIQEATEAIEKNLNAGCYVGDLLRIIKEKNAEIERLQKQLKEGIDLSDDVFKIVKSEAIKEFAEKAIQTVTEFFDYQPHLDTKEDVLAHTFRILKELTRNLHATYTKLARKAMNERF